jgi:protein-S-isoprenylcysteine O-methyltransferase Ste14
MAQILLGALAFATGLAFDWASWRRIRCLKPLLGLTTVATFGTALVWTMAAPGRYDWPRWASLVGWLLALVAVLLLAYSLFIEIPFVVTYARKGTGDTLVTTGTYALTRHPGVLWFGLLMLGLVLASRGRLMLLAGAVWLLLDGVYVWLQEVFLFRRMFPGYSAYQRATPMLVPNLRSVRRCLRTLPVCSRELS